MAGVVVWGRGRRGAGMRRCFRGLGRGSSLSLGRAGYSEKIGAIDGLSYER